ncbi:MAG: TRAP transporter substrate-binding protein [Cetobacterium sp.]
MRGKNLLKKVLFLGVVMGNLALGADIILKLADNHADDYPTVLGDKEFARLVNERSNGKIKVEVYSGGQLGSEENTIEQVQFGAIDMIRTSISPLTRYNDKLNVLMLPYLYRDDVHMFKVLDGQLGDKYLESLTRNNLLGLSWFDSGARNFYNSKRAVRNVSDMKGLKIRVQESALMMGLIEALGASATPMAFGEVYGALQTGVIDGAENNTPSYDSTGHFEVAKHYTLDAHTRVPEMLIINNKKFNSLSKDDQKLIKEAAKDAAIKQREFWKEREERSMNKIKAAGVEIVELTAEEKQEFQDAVKHLYDKFAKGQSEEIDQIIKE